MRISIDICDKVLLKDIQYASCIEKKDRKGCKAQLRKKWRFGLRRYRPMHIPTTCEWCKFVGEPSWHCMNSESPQYGINTHPNCTCPYWVVNVGLAMFLHIAWWKKMLSDTKPQNSLFTVTPNTKGQVSE